MEAFAGAHTRNLSSSLHVWALLLYHNHGLLIVILSYCLVDITIDERRRGYVREVFCWISWKTATEFIDIDYRKFEVTVELISK